jgi:divalent metal cation (Fe/Co/Zn/Cd) transporter
MAPGKTISIWFFIGCLILIYGFLILIAAIGELSSPPAVVMPELHAGIWWGAFLMLIGGLYVYFFRPGRQP